MPNNIIRILRANAPMPIGPNNAKSARVNHGQNIGKRSCHQGVGWCRGGNRNVEGSWGFLHLKIQKFQRLKVSKFLGFSASWFLGFLVSKFQRLTVSKFQSCWIDIDPMLPKFHFMFS